MTPTGTAYILFRCTEEAVSVGLLGSCRVACLRETVPFPQVACEGFDEENHLSG